jgi:hypothetical protein
VTLCVQLTTIIHSIGNLRHESKLVDLTDAISGQAGSSQTQRELVERQGEDLFVLKEDVKLANGNTLIIQDQLRELL